MITSTNATNTPVHSKQQGIKRGELMWLRDYIGEQNNPRFWADHEPNLQTRSCHKIGNAHKTRTAPIKKARQWRGKLI